MKLKTEKQWHFWVFALCIVLTIASWVIAIYYWGKLPQTIPTHFGISGMPDDWSNKSIWYVFMIPTLQTLILVGFGFLYYKPKYSNMPTTMLLDTLEKPKRNYAFTLIRNMLAVTLLFIGIFFTYLTFAMNYSAMNNQSGLNPWAMIVWLVALFAWLIFYNVKIYRVTKKFVAESKK